MPRTPQRDSKPTLNPMVGSALLHGGMIGAVVLLSMLHAFKGPSWGDNKLGGAIQVQMTAALPLPSDQKPNDNVLATDKPSPAPAPPPTPAPKAKEVAAPDTKAIAIPDKKAKQKPQPQPKKPTPPQPQQKPQKQSPQQKPQPTESKAKPQTKPVTTNRANYGEQQASSMPRATQANTTQIGNTSVQGGPTGFNYAYYVENLNRKMAQNWNKGEVDPRTARGTRAYLVFTIQRDGTPTNIQIDRSSGNYTLDHSCLRAAQRVDTFGPLPAGYRGSSVNVEYYCEF